MILKSLKVSLLFLLFFSGTPDFYSLSLKDIDSHPFNFSELKKSKATVVVFLLSDCPASQAYSKTLNNLSEKYAAQNVSFVGIFPGKFSTDDELKSFRSQYKIQFALLKDPEMHLAKWLSAKVAPEAFLIGQDGLDKYHGRIDDWMYSLGKTKPKVTKHDLDDAIHNYLEGKKINIIATEPIGCILEY